MLVRILLSVFRSFWQSIGRVWEVLPGTKPLRIVFFLFVLAVYNVRSFFRAINATILTVVFAFSTAVCPNCWSVLICEISYTVGSALLRFRVVFQTKRHL